MILGRPCSCNYIEYTSATKATISSLTTRLTTRDLPPLFLGTYARQVRPVQPLAPRRVMKSIPGSAKSPRHDRSLHPQSARVPINKQAGPDHLFGRPGTTRYEVKAVK